MLPQPPRRTTHIAGGPRNMLVYDRWGAFGRPVVLLHGLLFDRTMWWPAAAELSARASCTVVAPDLPGHGLTPAREEHPIDRIARDLAILVDGLGLHRAPVVVGHATSARLAEVFAGAYATQHVLTVDESPPGATGVDDLIEAAHLASVPEQYRPYAEPRIDPALLRAYGSWLAQPPTRRNELAVARRAAGRPHLEQTRFAPLADPEGFAAELQTLL